MKFDKHFLARAKAFLIELTAFVSLLLVLDRGTTPVQVTARIEIKGRSVSTCMEMHPVVQDVLRIPLVIATLPDYHANIC